MIRPPPKSPPFPYPPLSRSPVFNAAPSRAAIPAADVPVRHVLAFPPQAITAALALEPADVAIVGGDFVPDSFVHGPVRPGAALAGREGSLGVAAANRHPAEGPDIPLLNFKGPRPLQAQRFAY